MYVNIFYVCKHILCISTYLMYINIFHGYKHSFSFDLDQIKFTLVKNQKKYTVKSVVVTNLTVFFFRFLTKWNSNWSKSKENCHHDLIPFILKGIKYLFL